MNPATIDGQPVAPDPQTAGALTKSGTMAINPLMAPILDSQEVETDEINLADVWHTLLKRKWTILSTMLIMVAIAVLISILMTPIYQPTLTLQIEREPPKILESQVIAPVEDVRDTSFYDTQYELLKSRTLLERVIQQLDLTHNAVFMGTANPPFWQPAVAWVKNRLRQITGGEPLSQPDLVAMLLDSLIVEPVQNSRLVKLYYESPDPQLAVRILDTLASQFIQLNFERRFEASSYAKQYLEQRLEQTRAELEKSERKLLDYARQNGILMDMVRTTNPDGTTSGDASLNAKILGDLIIRQNQVISNRIQAEIDYKQMENAKSQGMPQILSSDVILQLKLQKTNLEAQYRDNLNIYKPEYPKMKQLADQIKQVDRQINQEVAYVRDSIKSQYEGAKINEGLVENRLKEVKQETLTQQEQNIQYNILLRDVDTYKQLYDSLLQRYKEVAVAAGISSNNITAIDKPEIPSEPLRPNLKLNLALAVFLGLLSGVALAFLFEHLDDSIRHAEELERHVKLPVLGIIPLEKQRQREPLPASLALMAQLDARSGFAEAYRSARTALQFSTSEGAPRVLLVTSTEPGEGKTTTAISLAINFAQLGKKVLLIDADLRKPSLHRQLNLENSIGLTMHLAGTAEPAEISQPTTVPNLFAITAGASPPNPAELLASARMVSLLSLAAEKFDHVIVDAPPVLGLADSLILGSLAAGTVMVVQAGTTRRSHLQGAIKRLKSTKTHIVGCILTKLIADKGGAYAYYHNQYYYYYDGDSRQKKLTPAARM